MIDWDDCTMETERYERVKNKVKEMRETGWHIKDLVAEVYNLFQDYLISEEQEEELYAIADPEEKYNSPAEYWYKDYGCLPIWECANGGI